MCLHRTALFHSVNAIQNAHNAVSHSESTHVLGAFRTPHHWSPNNRSVTDNYHNIHWALIALHNAERLKQFPNCPWLYTIQYSFRFFRYQKPLLLIYTYLVYNCGKNSAITAESDVPSVPYLHPTNISSSVYSVHQSFILFLSFIDVYLHFTTPMCRYCLKTSNDI